MKDEKNEPTDKGNPKEKILREDDGKKTPPTHVEDYTTGGDTSATRPEKEPDVHPHERTEGIP